jgi:AraC-like DNA-binding protein
MKKQINPIISRVVPEVKKVFDKNYAAESIDTLASSFSISRNALQDAFKRECGIGIREYKLKQRMEVARQKLKEGKGIKEIAFTLRYGTISAFSRAFKNYYNISPTAWLNAGRNV